MKNNFFVKTILAVGVILVFVVYTFHQRGDGKGSVIVPPSSSSSSGSATSTTTSSSSSGAATTLKDGTFTGNVESAYYGNVQVQAVIKNGKLSDVKFLQYPNDNPNSSYINQQATPYLRQEALQVQSASVNIITGATLTSQAFQQSLSTALKMAQT